MMKAIRGLALVTAALLAQTGFADTSEHVLYGNLGFSEGGVAFGAEYEYTGKPDFGLGGSLRIYQKDKDRKSGAAAGGMVVGGFIRPHFTKKAWDFYVSPGLAIITIDSPSNPPGDTTTLGPILALGLLYDLNGKFALGFSSQSAWVWFDEDYRGHVVQDMLVSLRINL